MIYKAIRFILLLPFRLLLCVMAPIIFFLMAESFEEYKEFIFIFLKQKVWE